MPPADTTAATLDPPPPATADSNRAAMDDKKSVKGLIVIFAYAVVAIGSLSACVMLAGKPRHGNSPWYDVLMYLSLFTCIASGNLLFGSLVLRFQNNSIIAPKATTYVRKGPGFKSSKVAPSAASDVNEHCLASDGHSNRAAAMDDRKSGDGQIVIFMYVVVAIGGFEAMVIFSDNGNSPWYRVLMYLSLFTSFASFMMLVVSLLWRFRNNPIIAPKATTYVRNGPDFESNSKVAPSVATDVNEHRFASEGLIVIFVYAVVGIGTFKATVIFLDNGNRPWYRALMYLSLFTSSASFMMLVLSLVWWTWWCRNSFITAPKAITYVGTGPGFKSNSKVAPSAVTDVNEHRLASDGRSVD